MAITKGTDAEDSDLLPGDVVTIIDDSILVGLQIHLAMEKLAGPKGSNVELTTFRMSKSGKQRVFSTLVRDVEMPPAEAEPGMDVKRDIAGGLIVRSDLPMHVSVFDV